MPKTTDDIPATYSDEQNLQESNDAKKLRLEIEKLEREIKYTKWRYFPKIILPILIPSLITAIVTGITIYFLYANLLVDVKEKSIDTKIKYNETILQTIELTHKRDDLNKQVADFETRKSNLRDSLSFLNDKLGVVTKSMEDAKNAVTASRQQAEGFKQQSDINRRIADEKSDSLKKVPIIGALKNIDATIDFSYERNRLAYDDFASEIRKNDQVSNSLLSAYVSSDKLTNNKLLVAMIAYKNLSNKAGWFATYLNLLDSSICYSNNKPYSKTINSKEWNDSDYHKIIAYIIDHGMNTRSCKTNAYNLLNILLNRSDLDLTANGKDDKTFLDFLSLYKENTIRREMFNLVNVNKVINAKNIPKSVSKMFLCEYIVRNKESFKSFVIKREDDPKQLKGIGVIQLNNIVNALKISREDFLSIDYWENLHDLNSKLISRLMENDFETYKTKPIQLVVDMQEQ